MKSIHLRLDDECWYFLKFGNLFSIYELHENSTFAGLIRKALKKYYSYQLKNCANQDILKQLELYKKNNLNIKEEIVSTGLVS